MADIVAGLQIVSSRDGGAGLGESGCDGILSVMWKDQLVHKPSFMKTERMLYFED